MAMSIARRSRRPSAYYPNRRVRQTRTSSKYSQELCTCADPFCLGGYDCSLLQFVTTYNYVYGRRLS